MYFNFSYSTSASSAMNIPNPFAYVCIRPRSPTNPPTTTPPTTTPWYNFGNQSCFYFRLYSPPAPLNCASFLQGFAAAASCGSMSLSNPGLPSQPPTCGPSNWCLWPLQLAIGQSVTALAYFKLNELGPSLNPWSPSLNVAITSSPGLPNGAVIGPTVATSLPLVSTKDPTATLAYPIVYRAVTLNATLQDLLPAASGAAPASPIDSILYGVCLQPAPAAFAPACAGLRVVRPRPAVLVSHTDLPLDPDCVAGGGCDAARGISPAGLANGTCGLHRNLSDDGPACVPAGSPVDVRVRCAYAWTVVALDDHGPADVDAGLRADLYAAALSVDPAGPAWPAGATLSAPTADVLELVNASQGGAGYAWPVTRYTVRWSPARGAEGGEFVLCLRVADAATGVFARRVCTAALRVLRCQFCARPGDTLRSIALEFETDWLQLWGANVGVADPDALTPAATGPADPAVAAAGPAAGYLNLGPVYVAPAEQPAPLLAAAFEVPLGALLQMNPDLQPLYAVGRPIPLGAEVCLVPTVCSAGAPLAS